VYPVSGPKIANATVLIRDGTIVAVGTNVTVAGRREADRRRGVCVTPGLIGRGQRSVEIAAVPRHREGASRCVKAWLRPSTWPKLNPASDAHPHTRIEGVTTALATPEERLISGQAS